MVSSCYTYRTLTNNAARTAISWNDGIRHRRGQRMAARFFLLAGLALLAASGCHNPQGGIMPYTGGTTTYYSTEQYPCTITLVDTRTGEPFFTLEVPVGKQLTLDFREGEGDDAVNTPDLMRYEVWPIGTAVGTLRNAQTVPDRWSRRIDVDYRRAPEYPPSPAEDELRIDSRRPDWWSPRGGRMPDNPAMTIYDE
jgi:hypothetical protein